MMGIIINNQIMSAEHKFNLIPYHMLLWKQFLFRAHLCLRKDILRTASGNILTPTYFYICKKNYVFVSNVYL